MSFKDNLKAKIELDGLAQKIASTIRETPGHRRMNKEFLQKLLDRTDLEYMKIRDLQLYLRPLQGEIMEIFVFDNELPLYHTTVDDVALRKSPEWKEMFSVRNIRRILNDQDVIVSKGKESLKRIHAIALALLDLTYTSNDLNLLVDEAHQALIQKSSSKIRESFDLFFELLDFQPLSLGILPGELKVSAIPKGNGGGVPLFENLIVFDEERFLVSLKKGAFSPKRDLDLAWLERYVRGEETADLQGREVFEFLADLALKKAETNRQ